jgi:hypothetical protein
VKVKELIAQLSKLDQNLEVFCYEDGPVPLRNEYPGPFDITSASSARMEISRTSVGQVAINFDRDAPGAREYALIGITSDM